MLGGTVVGLVSDDKSVVAVRRRRCVRKERMSHLFIYRCVRKMEGQRMRGTSERAGDFECQWD